jgi:hypothetical protein
MDIWVLVLSNIVIVLSLLIDGARIRGLERRLAEVEKRLEVSDEPEV